MKCYILCFSTYDNFFEGEFVMYRDDEGNEEVR